MKTKNIPIVVSVIAITLASSIVIAQTNHEGDQKAHANRHHAPSRVVTPPPGQTQFGDPLLDFLKTI